MKKYELTENKKEFFGSTLYQIKALIDIPVFGVKKGDLGGWIESEHNLSHDGNCWVGGNACIYRNARVSGNAYVYDNAQVFDNALVLDDACVYGDAEVSNNACVYDKAKVSGSACVYGNVQVYGNAQVSGNVLISDSAKISSNAQIESQEDIFYASSVGSNDSNLTAYKNSDGSIQVTRGCFNGTLEEFEEAVKNKHKGTKYEEEYLILIDFIRCRFGV